MNPVYPPERVSLPKVCPRSPSALQRSGGAASRGQLEPRGQHEDHRSYRLLRKLPVPHRQPRASPGGLPPPSRSSEFSSSGNRACLRPTHSPRALGAEVAPTSCYQNGSSGATLTSPSFLSLWVEHCRRRITDFKSGLLGPCDQVHPCENSPKCPGARAPPTAVSNACPAQRANHALPQPVLTQQPPELRPLPRLAQKSRPPALGGRAKCPLKPNEAIRYVVKDGSIRRGSQCSEH